MNKYINKILIVLLILCCVPMLFGEMISKREKKNRKGQKVIIERYRNEADGLIKVEKTLVAENRILANYYYKNNPEGIERKEVDSIKDKINIQYTYYKENNPENIVEAITRTFYEEDRKESFVEYNPDYITFFCYKQEAYTDIEAKSGHFIFYYNNRDDKIYKQIRFKENYIVTKEESYYKDEEDFLEQVIVYYENYLNKIYEKIESYYEKDNPKGYIKDISHYDGNKRKTERYFKNRNDSLIKHVFFYENDVLVKTISYFENGERGEAFYKNGKIDRGTLYNPDGSIKREDKF